MGFRCLRVGKFGGLGFRASASTVMIVMRTVIQGLHNETRVLGAVMFKVAPLCSTKSQQARDHEPAFASQALRQPPI